MILRPTDLEPATLVELDPSCDSRGSFARFHCERQFQEAGLPSRFVQTSLSKTARRGTIRGMHFQISPSKEEKLVRCISGRLYDVIVDLRKDSTTYLQYFSVELDAEKHLGVYVPRGFAHGFQCLTDNVEILYQMTDFYAPELSFGFRWNDPACGIEWPISAPTMNDRDRQFPDIDRTVPLDF